MSLKTKIVLSEKELALVKNEDWILTKQVIIQKVYEILNECIPFIDKQILNAGAIIADLPLGIPKISKGENYLGLPYVTLDHPRLFNKEDIFALRTMFWWGKFFSITLHVAGGYKPVIADRIITNLPLPVGAYICIHKEQWHHHFEEDNYLAADRLSSEQIKELLQNGSFIKIALKFDLALFNEIQTVLAEGYKQMGKMIR